MSTAKIQEALDWLENYLDHNDEAQAARREARAEVEAIEKAATIVARNGVMGPKARCEWSEWEVAQCLLAAIARQEESK